MKLSISSKVFSAAILATSLSVIPFTLSAQAQTQPETAPNTYQQPTGTVDTARTENNFDWGWLGLLGLAGLAGLIPKKRQEPVYRTDTEPDVVTRSRSDYR